MAKSQTITQYKSPKAPLVWVKITGDGEEDMQGRLKFLASTVLTEEQKNTLEATLDAFWKENKPKGCKKMKSNGISKEMRKTEETDEDGDAIKEPTGNYLLQMKTNATWPDGNANKIKIYNAKGNPVQLGDTKIGNGSVGRLAGAYDIYAVTDKQGNVTNAGITFYLNGIQISKLEEYKADDVEFEADEDEDAWTGEDDSFEGSDEDETPKAGPRL
tara:strand:- start:2260 stop:2907 length:648 start_codon:yes stop_codon:yes gene_type:complete